MRSEIEARAAAGQWWDPGCSTCLNQFSGELGVELAQGVLSRATLEFGPSNAIAGHARVCFGRSLLRVGRPAEALQQFEEALPVVEREYGCSDPGVADVLQCIGAAHSRLGDFARAADFCERALAAHERALGPDDPRVADSLVHLAGAIGDATRAKELLERALRIRERVHGPQSVEVAHVLARLGRACTKLGEHLRARNLLERALPVQERAYGPESTPVAETLSDLAVTQLMLGEALRCRDLTLRALQIQQVAYGPESGAVADTLWQLGVVYSTLGDKISSRKALLGALPVKYARYGRSPTRRTLVKLRGLMDDAPLLVDLERWFVDMCRKDSGGPIEPAFVARRLRGKQPPQPGLTQYAEHCPVLSRRCSLRPMSRSRSRGSARKTPNLEANSRQVATPLRKRRGVEATSDP